MNLFPLLWLIHTQMSFKVGTGQRQSIAVFEREPSSLRRNRECLDAFALHSAIYIVLLVKRSGMLIMCLGPLIYLTRKVGIHYYLKLPDPIFPPLMGLFYEAWTLQIRRCIRVENRRAVDILRHASIILLFFISSDMLGTRHGYMCPSKHACLWRCPCP